MKALIVDDEKHVRDAIRLLVPWQRFGIDTILEAADGLAGMAIIESERPEIVFTDMMMPNAGGTELLEWVSVHSPNCKIIVISGHDDFNFVRTAVKYGGMDYILKPIDAEQLADAVSKAVDSWNADEEARRKNRHMNMELNQLKPLHAEQVFSKLLHEPGSNGGLQAALEPYGLPKSVQQVRIAVLSLDMIHPSIHVKFGESGRDLLTFMLMNICSEILRGHNAGCALRHWGQDRDIVLVLWSELSRAEEIVSEISDAIFFALKAGFIFGIGLAAEFPAKIADSYKQARHAVTRRNLLRPGIWCHVYEPPAAAGGPAKKIFFNNHEERVRFAVQSGNKEQVRRSLKPWFDEMDQLEVITPEQLNRWWQEFQLAKSVWQGQDGAAPASPAIDAEAHMTVPVNGNGEFDFEEWKQSFLRAACEVADRLSEKDPNRSVIKDIAKYIEQYAHEEITLQHISEKFYLSREYISRKFKHELNENLSDYITKIRIARAKELLAGGQLKISQVAELSGFQDEKYFSKVFKKWTNTTPNEYRKQHIADQED